MNFRMGLVPFFAHESSRELTEKRSSQSTQSQTTSLAPVLCVRAVSTGLEALSSPKGSVSSVTNALFGLGAFFQARLGSSPVSSNSSAFFLRFSGLAVGSAKVDALFCG
jgi:hypothetical protein